MLPPDQPSPFKDPHAAPPPLAPPIVAPEIAAHSRNLATEDVPCLNCGYNLRGLSEAGNCPECGTPIERSLHGNLLIYSSPDYVRSLHLGLVIIIAAIIAMVVATVGTISLTVIAAAMPATPGGSNTNVTVLQAIASFVSGGLSLIALVGWWMFSAPDPAVIGQETGSRARVVVRTAVLITVAVTVFQAVIEATATSTIAPGAAWLVGAVGFVGVVVWVVKFFAAMLYLRWLAPRLPSREIDRKSRTYMWLIPLLTILAPCTIYLSVLAAMIIYVLLLDQVRRKLRTIREQQAIDLFPA